MNVLAEVNFLDIDRSEHKFKYIDGCKPFITYSALDGMAGCMLRLDKEAFDGDLVELEINFYDESVHIEKIKEGDLFDLYVGTTHIAMGKFTIIM